MEVTLLDKELDLLLDFQVKSTHFKSKKDSFKQTIELGPACANLVDRISTQYYSKTGLPHAVRLNKYVNNINIPEHIDKTLFSLVYQYNDIPGFQYFYNDAWIDFPYNRRKILLCFDEKSKQYNYEPVPHRLINDVDILRHSLTIHVDDLDIW